jgi:hypothetical protein
MLEVPPAADDDPVEALAPERPDAAPGVGVGPRCPDRCADDTDLWGAQIRSALGAVLPGSSSPGSALSSNSSARLPVVPRLFTGARDIHAACQDECGLGCLGQPAQGVNARRFSVAAQAATLYSWIRPPSRSRLRTAVPAGAARRSGVRAGSGAPRLSARCGRWPL